MIAAVLLLPSAVALTFELPAAIPLTSPDVVTVATAVAELAQVIVRPVTVLPATSVSAALS